MSHLSVRGRYCIMESDFQSRSNAYYYLTYEAFVIALSTAFCNNSTQLFLRMLSIYFVVYSENFIQPIMIVMLIYNIV